MILEHSFTVDKIHSNLLQRCLDITYVAVKLLYNLLCTSLTGITIMLMKCLLRAWFYNYATIEAMLFCCPFDGPVKIFWDVSFVHDIF